MNQINKIFQERTCYDFASKQVPHEILKEIYNIVKLGPTSANSCPLRIIFVEKTESKEKLAKCVMEGNVSKVLSASCTAIFAYDTKFYQKMEKLYPHDDNIRKFFSSSEDIATDTAKRNSALQAAYFMIVARSFGLAIGAMSGFNKEEVDKQFLAGTGYKSDFLCNIGYAKGENPYPRLPRLDFDEACLIL